MSEDYVRDPVPRSILDPRTNLPRFGAYRGAFTHFELDASLRQRATREKRWIYLTFVKEPYLIALAILDLGYIQSAFAFVYEEGRGLVVDMPSQIGVPLLSTVRCDGVHRIYAHVRAASGTFTVSERRGSDGLEVSVSTRSLSIRARVNYDPALAPPLSVVARIPGGIADATEKRALLTVEGVATFDGKRIELDGGRAGFDITWGLLARDTAWNWAFLMGKTEAGVPIALNLTEGFVGEPECVAFSGGELHRLGEGRFQWDRHKPLSPWKIGSRCGGCDLVFQPGALHHESLSVGLVESHFVQPIGSFSGTIRLGAETHTLARVLGVVEDQRVHW